MILLDADVLLIDLRYQNDARFPANRQVLDQINQGNVAAGITSQALLEVIGILSFNLSSASVAQLPVQLPIQYRLVVFPDLQHHPEYAGCAVDEVVRQILTQMSLGDAVQAIQITRFAPTDAELLTWNAGHFVGKISIPVLTPEDWLNRQP